MKKIIVLVFIFFIDFSGIAQCVSTLAGTGLAGYADGTGIVSKFYNPLGLAVDASGNVYVADAYNDRIRKITSAGVVTTLAGSGLGGYSDGNAIAARFDLPTGVCVDASGNVYVADMNNNCIRKITLAGIVTTLAGSGVAGFTNGTGMQASFDSPKGVAVDASGNLYVADIFNNRIRKITPAGVVTTFAGGVFGYADGTGTSAQFSNPHGVAVDGSGNVYVADTENYKIRKITPAGVVTTLASDIIKPVSIAVDASGNVYVAEYVNNRIRKITPAGVVTTLAGSSIAGYADGAGNSALFNNPQGIAVDGSGNVYVSDTSNQRIRKILYYPVTVSLNYSNSTYCLNNLTAQPNLSGSGNFNGGTFSSTSGLSINSTTGVFIPSASSPGTYVITYTTPLSSGCQVSTTTSVTILPAPTASISADGVVATSNTITNGSSVQLQLNGTLNAQPNIQWTPATGISSATVANPVVYPSATTTYTASFVNNNGCTQTTSFTVNVTPQPNIGNLSLSTSTATIGLFDTITVDVQLNNATNLYSLYMKLKGNAAVSQYLDYSGHTAGTLLGTNVISTAPTVTNGVPDFGMTKVGAVPGYSGSGLFYSFRFVPKNNVVIPAGTTFCFYLDDVSSYNASGIPCGLTNQGQYCYTFTNQVAVWPGDLNKSNTVTTADILPIGYFYNSTGAARPNATIQWTAQPATLWGYNRTSTNSDAYKVFADSNGDGVINNADQAAIGFNMNQVHNRMAWPTPNHFSAQAQQTLAVGTLTVTPNSTIINGAALPQTVTFTVSVNNTGGINALYGMSVNLGFDNTVFDLSTATVDYTGSIFGNAGSDCLVMNYNSDNTVSVGLTRFGNAPINGQGLLFKVTIQTKTTLPNLTQTPVTAYVDAANNQAGDTLVIQDAPATNFTIINNLGLDTIKQDEFVLYPNPVNDILMIKSSTIINKISVYNTLGQLLISKNENSKEFSVDLASLSNGNYFIRLESNNKNELFKIVKM